MFASHCFLHTIPLRKEAALIDFLVIISPLTAGFFSAAASIADLFCVAAWNLHQYRSWTGHSAPEFEK